VQVAGGAAVTSVQTTSVSSGYYIHPVPGSVVTQRSHGYNAVDFGAPTGTYIFASASGRVVTSVNSGWNGGYGKFIVIEHPNGTRTLYSHLSSVIISRGQQVVQGQVIGYMGSTGRSTGSHLHFEIRGAHNPFTACGLRTRCGS
jgi:murein DD-endopeptidase MepM/ murein hydrolase activator NlpD